MSYIRCLNNPEGLYIWWDVSQQIAIVEGASPIKWAPLKEFHALCRKFHKHHNDVDIDTGLHHLMLRETDNYAKYMLTYTGDRVEWSIVMWQVTWHYIVNNVMHALRHIESDKRKKRSKRKCKRSLKRKSVR